MVHVAVYSQLETLSFADLNGHDTLLVILGKVSDELQQLITLLLGGTHPTPLRKKDKQIE